MAILTKEDIPELEKYGIKQYDDEYLSWERFKRDKRFNWILSENSKGRDLEIKVDKKDDYAEDSKNNYELQVENGVWEGGIWKRGAWYNGTWEDGTWEDGEWEYGIWEDGIWEDGTWEDGRWENGTWEDGIWEYGTWEYGTWKNGVWKYGTWKNGIWVDGTWENGIWENGVWIDGGWENGTWESGVWADGSWGEGVWKEGIWLKGDILTVLKENYFRNGIFFNIEIYGGKYPERNFNQNFKECIIFNINFDKESEEKIIAYNSIILNKENYKRINTLSFKTKIK